MRNILQIDTILEYTLPHTRECFEELESLDLIKEKLQNPFFQDLVLEWEKRLNLCLQCQRIWAVYSDNIILAYPYTLCRPCRDKLTSS